MNPASGNDSDSLLRRAESAYASGRVAEAEAIWQHLLTLDPGHPEALFHLGNRCRERGEHTAAIADYERALERVPGHAGLLNNLALTLEAIGKVERAEACYRDILTREPKQPDALLNLANLRYRAARYTEAAALHQRAAAVIEAAHLREIGRLRHGIGDGVFLADERREPSQKLGRGRRC